MIIIPLARAVVILPPRTASTYLRDCILGPNGIPGSFSPYRHMEADGVPVGYDKWDRFGIVRHPADRMWSLYHYLKNIRKFPVSWHPARLEVMSRDVDRPFLDWLTKPNFDAVFATSSLPSGEGFNPKYHTLHPAPEQEKSQWQYLRPDLGTRCYAYQNGVDDLLKTLADRTGIHLSPLQAGRPNSSVAPPMPEDDKRGAILHFKNRERFLWEALASMGYASQSSRHGE